MDTVYEVNKDNARHESFYNLCQLVRLTGYAMPHWAIEDTGEIVRVIKDECGNIKRLAD